MQRTRFYKRGAKYDTGHQTANHVARVNARDERVAIPYRFQIRQGANPNPVSPTQESSR